MKGLGLPVIIILIVVINVVSRVVKAANESSRSNDNWNDNDSDSDWSDWTAGDKNASPSQSFSPPPKPPVTPSVSPSAPRPVSQLGTSGNGSRPKTLQQMLMDVRQAVETQNKPPAPPSPRVPTPPPTVTSTVDVETKSVFKNMSDVDGPPAEAGKLRDSELMPHINAEAKALEDDFAGDTLNKIGSDKNRSLRLKIRGKRDLRRSILVREVLDRPRAFDM